MLLPCRFVHAHTTRSLDESGAGVVVVSALFDRGGVVGAGTRRRRVVAARYADEGAMLDANEPLLSIVDLDEVVVVVFATERDYAALAPGQAVPVAAIGVLVVLAATGTTLDVQSAIGCIMLGGIVVNNAILLVDQAGRLGQQGRAVDDAVVEAGRLRLRPILMTTATTVLALLPLALGVGEGADAQAPLARAVLGGLTASTVITLVLIPAVYSLVHRRGSSGTVGE